MKDTISVELPSGGWWEFRKPTKYRDYQAYRALAGTSDDSDDTFGDKVLILFTESWSFGDVSLDALGDLAIEDGIAGQRAFNDKVMPFLSQALTVGVNSTTP